MFFMILGPNNKTNNSTIEERQISLLEEKWTIIMIYLEKVHPSLAMLVHLQQQAVKDKWEQMFTQGKQRPDLDNDQLEVSLSWKLKFVW